MAPATGLEGGNDPPATPLSTRVMDSFHRFRVTHNFVSPQRIQTPPTASVSERIATTSPKMNQQPVNDVTINVTSAIVDNEIINDIIPILQRIEPDGSSSEDLSLSNNNNKISRPSVPTTDIDLDSAKKAKSSSSIKSRDPDGSVAGAIKLQVAEQD